MSIVSPPVDMSRLPAPDVIEVVDFEATYTARKSALVALFPRDVQGQVYQTLALESEPASKLLQENSYREIILRNRINGAARAVMLATATGADLDNLVALLGVTRLTLVKADAAASQPTNAVLEGDEDLRRRSQLALEGATVAGSRGSYTYHALSAHADVADAYVDSPRPGEVSVHILSKNGDGTPSADVLDTVQYALSAEDVRPLCDYVSVHPAVPVYFSVSATLFVPSGPAQSVLHDAAYAALQAYLDRPRRIGASVPLSAIYAALHQPGVTRVEMSNPIDDVNCGAGEAAFCVAIDLTTEAA